MKNIVSLTIYRDSPVQVTSKEVVARFHRPSGKRLSHRFNTSPGDIPCWIINGQSPTPTLVVNPRGEAYAARKRQEYRADRRKAARRLSREDWDE